METRARTRPLLRRAGMVAALAALLVPAAAGPAAAKSHHHHKHHRAKPVIKKISPRTLAIGETLTIRGHHFKRGRNRNSVAFKRHGHAAVFVKADIGTHRLLKVELPERLEKVLLVRDGLSVPTKLRLRVLSRRFGKHFSKGRRAPMVVPPHPPVTTPPPAAADGDCDGDGQRNGVDADDDNDLLPDTLEQTLKTDPCKADSDGDGVPDGYEYRSALDLNDDEYQDPQTVLPGPWQLPYPNALFADAEQDYDGDSLTLGEEYALWRFTVAHGAPASLDALTYSDGEQYTMSARQANGRRTPTLAAASYDKHVDFVNWAVAAGYRTVWLSNGRPWYDGSTGSWYGLFDLDRSDPLPGRDLTTPEATAEIQNLDSDGDGYLSDDERDEDADGLSNYDETHGRAMPGYWTSCYTLEQPYRTAYAGTSVTNPDSDGDGVRDGADDQDHDDIPNVMELSRRNASHLDDREGSVDCKPAADLPKPPDTNHAAAYGRVNPFNPCLPATWSRTCERYVTGGAPFDGSPDWYSLN